MQINSKYLIRPVCADDICAIQQFTDQWIGTNYFSFNELEEVLELSRHQGKTTSLGAFYQGELAAIRLTFAPGKWQNKVRGQSQEKWNVDPQSVAYFKSLFVAGDHQAQGLGKILSNQSMEIVKELGGKAILCHSWMESPNNSSMRYLDKMGFEQVAVHPLYWNPIEYDCTRCAPIRCQCTAAEMIKYLD